MGVTVWKVTHFREQGKTRAILPLGGTGKHTWGRGMPLLQIVALMAILFVLGACSTPKPKVIYLTPNHQPQIDRCHPPHWADDTMNLDPNSAEFSCT